MKIRCRREKFAPMFSLISSFVSSHDVRPVLQNVKMVVDDKTVLLMATDGKEVGGRAVLNVEDGFVVEEAGEVVLPTKIMRQILAETNDEEFTLELENGRLLFKSGRVKYQLDMIEGVDKFPQVAPFGEESFVRISSSALTGLIRRTVFATDTNNAHYELRGVKVIFGEDRTQAVATDGRRLAFQETASEFVRGGDAEFSEIQAIFPPRALNLIERSIGDAESVDIAVKVEEAYARVGNVVVAVHLMSGRFPDWKTIIPDRTDKKRVDFIAGELARSIRQAEIVATDDKPGVWFRFSEGNVNIAAAGEATGESSVDLPIAYSPSEEDKTEIRIDSKFLNDFFKNIGAEDTLAFYFIPDYRTLFETSDGYLYVVMQLA